MKTTLDLPEDLVRAVKILAVEENRKLKDMTADLLRRGLAQKRGVASTARRRLKLPLVECAHEARPDEEMTSERVAEVLLEEEAGVHREALHQRLGPGPLWESSAANREAWSVYEAFLADDRIAFRADEPVGVEPSWKELAVRRSASPKLWMDAYLAAFAMAGRYSMVTTDAAFRQFRALDLLILGHRGAWP